MRCGYCGSFLEAVSSAATFGALLLCPSCGPAPVDLYSPEPSDESDYYDDYSGWDFGDIDMEDDN